MASTTALKLPIAMPIFPLLAEVAPPDHSAWMTNLAFLLSMVAIVVNIISGLSNRSQRREVTFGTEFARKADLDRVEKAFEKAVAEFRIAVDVLQRDLHAMQNTLQHSSEERAVAIHDRINGVSEELTKAVSELRGEIKHLSRSV